MVLGIRYPVLLIRVKFSQNAVCSYKARPVPYALQPKVEATLRKLEADGVIKPVQFSKWAPPIVSVLKPDGSVRICGDYKAGR